MVFEEPILRGGSTRTKFVQNGFESLTKTKALQILESSTDARMIIDMGNYALSFPERRKNIAEALTVYSGRRRGMKKRKIAKKVLSSILAASMLEALI